MTMRTTLRCLLLPVITIVACFAPSVHGQGTRSSVTRDDRERWRTQSTQPFCCQREQFVVAGPELLALQLLPWYFNRHVADDATADLSLRSWHRNIQLGFEWDPNSFRTNMFDHPFHGNAFFNAARSNGYDFWESSSFTYAGSFIWEFFGENNRPAINDWAMTSIGGLTIGEALHRTAKMVRDNQATGARRTFLEFAGFLIDPVGGFSRALRGEMSRIGPNPPDRYPTISHTNGMVGFRSISKGRFPEAKQATAFGTVVFQYGDPYEDYAQPFDAFNLFLQFNTQEKVPIGQFQIAGVLFGNELYRSDNALHVFTIEQIFDYVNNQTYEVGGQSFGFTLRSRLKTSETMSVRTVLQPTANVMTGIVSEYFEILDRDYDFGSGFGFRAAASLNKSGFNLLRVGYLGAISHTLSGAAGNQVIQFVRATAQFPLRRPFGIGAEYILHMRDGYFRDFPDVHRRDSEYRVFLLLI